MNTVRKGDILENHLFNILSKQIEEDRFLFYKKEYLKIYKKKSYFSTDRDDKVIFDVVIEVSKPNSERPHLILLFECKNYTHAVPVNDVTELFGNGQGIIKHASNVKCILVTNAKLQSATESFLKNKGMGYIQLSENQVDITDEDWILQRSPSWYGLQDNQTDIYAIHTLYTGQFPNSFTACYFNHNYIGYSFYLFLDSFLRDTIFGFDDIKNNDFKPFIPFIPEQKFEVLAYNIRKDSNKVGMNFLNDLVAIEQQKTGLNVKFIHKPNFNTLGSISFERNEITIYLQDNIERNTFTLAHELAHYYLKHGIFIKQETMSSNHLNIKILNKELKRMEFQANQLATCLLLPKNKFLESVYYILYKLNIKNRGYGLLYLDEQKCNQQNFYNITDILKFRFQVSREVIKIRLLQLGILIEK